MSAVVVEKMSKVRFVVLSCLIALGATMCASLTRSSCDRFIAQYDSVANRGSFMPHEQAARERYEMCKR